jgi:hypothetical protein
VRARRLARRVAGPWTYAALIAVLAGSAFPVYWSFVVSSQTPDAPEVLAAAGAFGLSVHLLEVGRRARFVQGDAGGHGTSEG